MKKLFCAFAGIPNYQLATNMNTSNSNLEPGWATYLKSAALIFPAIFVWVGCCVWVVPKLKEICVVSGTRFPEPIWTALALSEFCKNHFFLGAIPLLAALILLEWRSRRWPRYRRLVFGIAAFSFNFIALVLITTMMVFAVVAGANLLPHAK
jgi:type II secretory pathway component PulF